MNFAILFLIALGSPSTVGANFLSRFLSGQPREGEPESGNDKWVSQWVQYMANNLAPEGVSPKQTGKVATPLFPFDAIAVPTAKAAEAQHKSEEETIALVADAKAAIVRDMAGLDDSIIALAPQPKKVPDSPQKKLPASPQSWGAREVEKAKFALKLTAKPHLALKAKPHLALKVVAVAVVSRQSPGNASTNDATSNMTIHDHSAAAQKSAAEALHHLEQAKNAFQITKTNVKESLQAGKKIKNTAHDIKTLYRPAQPEAPRSSSLASATPAFLVLVCAMGSAW